MRFQEAYAGCQDKRLTQQDAGQLLGVSERTFRRQIGRFEADGMQGLVDLRPFRRKLAVHTYLLTLQFHDDPVDVLQVLLRMCDRRID